MKKFGNVVLREIAWILFSNVKFQDGHEESSVKCELYGKDLHGSFHKTVTIDGMTTDWAEANGIESGVTTFFANDAIIDEAEYKWRLQSMERLR